MLRHGITSLLVVCASASAPAHGQPAAPLRVVVVDGSDLAPILDRLRGQLSDVDVRLSIASAAEATTLPHDVLLRFDGMDRLDAPDPHLVVVVSMPADGTSLRQDIRPSRGSGQRSALLEQAAIFVRATLLALAEGGTIGVSPPSVREPRPRAASEHEPSPAPPPPTRDSPKLQPAIALGVFGAIDGQTAWGQRGIDLHVDLEVDIVRIGVRLAFGLPSEMEDARTRLHLWHHGVDGYAVLEGEPVEGVHLGAGASVGVALIHRSTEVLQPGLSPTAPAWNGAFRVGPRLSARWRPSDSRLELALAFVLDVVPSPVTFAYGAMEAGTHWDLWPVQPRLGLALRMLP